jgi:hypothetical protein
MASDLGERRKRFTKYLAMLLVRMLEKNYQPMIGKDGLKHMAGSLHYDGLAVDIDLCDKHGNYLSDTESHRQFGEYWESLDKDCFWGGDGPKEDGLKHDGNHYALTYMGKK